MLGVMSSLLVSLLLLSVSSISSAHSPTHGEDEYIHRVHVGTAVFVQRMCGQEDTPQKYFCVHTNELSVCKVSFGFTFSVTIT